MSDKIKNENYSFCESVYAAPRGKWHIRRLTKEGKKTSGGIDTISLCGIVKIGWDLEVEFSMEYMDREIICKECYEKYMVER